MTEPIYAIKCNTEEEARELTMGEYSLRTAYIIQNGIFVPYDPFEENYDHLITYSEAKQKGLLEEKQAPQEEKSKTTVSNELLYEIGYQAGYQKGKEDMKKERDKSEDMFWGRNGYEYDGKGPIENN